MYIWIYLAAFIGTFSSKLSTTWQLGMILPQRCDSTVRPEQGAGAAGGTWHVGGMKVAGLGRCHLEL